MFKRKWSGLPPDPSFPPDLEQLGYFINEDDEIRSRENSDNYWKFHINRNERLNVRQRFALLDIIEKEIHKRLQTMSLKKRSLPFSIPSTNFPHVPIFTSSDLYSKSRVVVIFGDEKQDLGVLAQRVIGGRGGINHGSMVSVVAELQRQRSAEDDKSPPGIILANTGQLLWWPEGHRAVTMTTWDAIPMRSAVHEGDLIDDSKHRIPGNHTPLQHVQYIFEQVIPAFVKPEATLQVVGIETGVGAVIDYLGQNDVWGLWRDRVTCFANVGGLYPISEVESADFRSFVREKARAWVTTTAPRGRPISGPGGNPSTTTFTDQGCLVVSGGVDHHTELLMVEARSDILDFLQGVACPLGPEADRTYINPDEVSFADPTVPVNDHWAPDESTCLEPDVDVRVVDEDEVRAIPNDLGSPGGRCVAWSAEEKKTASGGLAHHGYTNLAPA